MMAFDDTRAQLLIRTLLDAGWEVSAVMPPGAAGQVLRGGARHVALPRVSCYFWPDSRWHELLLGLWQRFRNSMIAIPKAWRELPAICVCHEPDSWLVGLVLKWFRGAALVVDLREVYEDRVSAFPPRFRTFLRRWMRKTLSLFARSSDSVIHVSEDRASLYRFPGTPSTVIHHYPHAAMFPAISPKRLEGLGGKFVVLHAGPLRPNYAGSEILHAIEIASAAIPDLVCLVLGGDARSGANDRPLLLRLAREGKLILLPRLPHDEALALMKGSDAGLAVVLPVDQTHQLACPVKLFEYLHVGLPVIGSNVSEIRRVLNQYECGITVDARNPGEIADAMIRLAQDPRLRATLSRNALLAAEKSLNWERERPKVIQLFDSVRLQALESRGSL
ncbi:MAG: glycosyltransferase [Terriglobia bacterium]